MELEDPVAFLRISNKLALLEESKSFESKKWVWIQDKKECFKAAEVKSSKGDIYVVETNDGQVCLHFALVSRAKFTPDPWDFLHRSQQQTLAATGSFVTYVNCLVSVSFIMI